MSRVFMANHITIGTSTSRASAEHWSTGEALYSSWQKSLAQSGLSSEDLFLRFASQTTLESAC
jgi:hypothetical protein